MPCDCPEDQPRRPTPSGSCNYLVYSGGPAANFYRLLEQAIPDVEMTHGRPIVHPDGSLEFPGPPPALSGFRQEGLRLYPTWPPCTLRMLQVQILDDALNLKGICGNPEAEHSSREATLEQCQTCALRRS